MPTGALNGAPSDALADVLRAGEREEEEDSEEGEERPGVRGAPIESRHGASDGAASTAASPA
jgi:hypothetical protein